MFERKQTFRHSKIQDTISFKRIKKFRFGKLVTEVLIFRSSRSQMFFKIGFLKNFAIFTGKHLRWSLQAFFYSGGYWIFAAANTFFQLNLVLLADSFFLRTPLKTRAKLQKTIRPAGLLKRDSSTDNLLWNLQNF